MDAGARTAAGRQQRRSRFDQNLEIPSFDGLFQNGPGGRRDQQADAGCDALSAKDVGGDREVLDPSAGAGADEGLVDLRSRQFRNGPDVVDGVGTGDEGR